MSGIEVAFLSLPTLVTCELLGGLFFPDIFRIISQTTFLIGVMKKWWQKDRSRNLYKIFKKNMLDKK